MDKTTQQMKFKILADKKTADKSRQFFYDGRSDWIRTSGHLNPIQVLYQTEPHPDNILLHPCNGFIL